ncbi:TetR/AcrR family transcriptional regulator [Streptomyces diacarni]|uniref:TetR/AcrR family transcriptional regulator n=1 Tax=Streptomyces diacarni TaxID=2800381 RepID=UPI001FEA4088|nr:helix-turn-helix domain-containing protein [Streptomyces diacarni]
MRADAQRNAEKLRAAAAELFQERGLQVPLEEIARRAGVSHGTLYNLFGTREALIDEVVTDRAARRGAWKRSPSGPWPSRTSGRASRTTSRCSAHSKPPTPPSPT